MTRCDIYPWTYRPLSWYELRSIDPGYRVLGFFIDIVPGRIARDLPQLTSSWVTGAVLP